MPTITIKGALYTKISEYTNQREWSFWAFEIGGGWVKVQDHTITVEQQVKEEDMIAGQVEVLNTAIANTKRMAWEKVQELEDRIRTISAIGYTVSPATEEGEEL
jgi:hypothetical protein